MLLVVALQIVRIDFRVEIPLAHISLIDVLAIARTRVQHRFSERRQPSIRSHDANIIRRAMVY
jgi:hypothetical protein